MFMFYVMDQRVYKDIRVFETVNELKAKVREECDSLSQRLINQVMLSFCFIFCC